MRGILPDSALTLLNSWTIALEGTIFVITRHAALQLPVRSRLQMRSCLMNQLQSSASHTCSLFPWPDIFCLSEKHRWDKVLLSGYVSHFLGSGSWAGSSWEEGSLQELHAWSKVCCHWSTKAHRDAAPVQSTQKCCGQFRTWASHHQCFIICFLVHNEYLTSSFLRYKMQIQSRSRTIFPTDYSLYIHSWISWCTYPSSETSRTGYTTGK